MRQLTGIAGPRDAGRQVKYFVRGDMGVSYHRFAALKARGGLLVNGAPAHADYRLRPGDEVSVMLEDAPRAVPAFDETPVQAVYEDEDILILEKPAPLACQCSPRQAAMTLENRLAWRYRDDPGFVFRPLNRLDRGTSGLMAAAKNAHACQLLQRQLHTPDFLREYLAVVDGRLEGAGAVDAPIAKEQAATIRRIVDDRRGVRAVTRYRVERPGEAHSLVRLRLETGRTHQIRVHMAHLGHPVAGDFLYGREDPRLPGRFALHSARIRLKHPITGVTIERESPLPEAPAQILKDDAVLGSTVTVAVDRPLGSAHPAYPDLLYRVNYGRVAGVMAPDGEEQDAYVLGADGPVAAFTGRVAAIVRRRDDVENKWVVCPEGMSYTAEEIMERVRFQERFFDSFIITADGRAASGRAGTDMHREY